MEPRVRRGVDFGGWLKYTAVIAVVVIALLLLKKKLQGISWAEFVDGLSRVPTYKIALAALLTAINFVVLTGYDWIAVRYLRKSLPIGKIMWGAIVGYSLSNIFGWIFGGTAVRYRMYTNWGFKLFEVITLLTILSLTFWLGMFLLAGIAFVALPVRWPKHTIFDAMRMFDSRVLGGIFLAVVGAYLAASAFLRHPIRWKDKQFGLPPFRLSLMQLVVSAMEFLLASAVLYVLLPHELINFSTVLVSYMAAMVAVVAVHAPGGIGVLEMIVLELLVEEDGSAESKALKISVACGLALYRVIYYFLPGAIGCVMYLVHEMTDGRRAAALAIHPEARVG